MAEPIAWKDQCWEGLVMADVEDGHCSSKNRKDRCCTVLALVLSEFVTEHIILMDKSG